MKLPLNIDWQQILLHALNLVILVGGLYALLFKPVKKFMDQRAENYQKMIADAEDAKAQAESLKAELSERMKQADAEAQTYRQEAMAKAEKEAAAALDSAKAQAEKIVAAAREKAANEEKQIVQNAQDEIARLSVEATQKLMDYKLSDVYNQFLDSAEGSEVHDQR